MISAFFCPKKSYVHIPLIVSALLYSADMLWAAPPSGETHGVIYAEIPDLTGKAHPLVRVNLPDIRVSMQNVATNESDPGVKTDLDGAFVLPPMPAGTYRLCWAAQGFVRGCRSDTFTTSEVTSYIAPTQITPQQNVIFGRVTFRDNSICRFVAPTFGVNLNATVTVTSSAGFLRRINANSAGYYVFGGVPFDKLNLEANCEKATITRATATPLSIVDFMRNRYDLVLPNQALSTIAFATPPGATIRTSASPGATVEVQSETLGSHPHPLTYRWQEETPQPGFTSPNAPNLTWKLPDAPRATLHVLVGDGFGTYSYKAVTLATDTKRIVFAGRVIDDNAQGVKGAEIAVNGVQTVSANNGEFSVILSQETPQYVLNIDKIGFKFFSRNLNAPATDASYQIFPAFEISETQATG